MPDYPRRCQWCGEELWSDDDLVEHVQVDFARIERRRAEAVARQEAEAAALAEVTPAVPHSTGRLVTDRFVAQFRAPAEQLVRWDGERLDAFAEHVKERLWHELKQYLEPYAFDLPIESVVVASFAEQDDVMNGVRWAATWSPDPTRGCQFRGGPMDGDVVALDRQDTAGRPQRWIVRAALRPLDFRAAAHSPVEFTTLSEVRYELAGCDPDTDQWVYLCR